MKQATQGVFILVGLCALLMCVAGSALGGQVVAPAAPTPAPQPTPGNPAADVVRETFSGLEQVGVGDLVRSGARANDANTKSVHTSALGQFVADVAPLLPFCIAGLLAGAAMIIALAVMWFISAERQAQEENDLEKLAVAVSKLEVFYRDMGVALPQDVE